MREYKARNKFYGEMFYIFCFAIMFGLVFGLYRVIVNS